MNSGRLNILPDDFGLSMLASISSGGAVKNLIGGVFGVWLSTIGAERVTAIERFMFGNYELYEGLSFVPVMIGLFAMSELLVQSKMANQAVEFIKMKAVQLPSRADYKKIWKTVVRSSGIGTFIGILPAEGATVASMIGYSEAKRWSKNKEEFGKGSIEGIAGAESANNAATGGAMVPTMVLGIPGSGTTAIILVGLMCMVCALACLFTEQAEGLPDIWVYVCCEYRLLAYGSVCCKDFCPDFLIPTPILWPIVFALSVIGAYALNSSLLDIWIVLIFGVIGFLARRFGFAAALIAVGLILARWLKNLQNSLKIFNGEWWLIHSALGGFFRCWRSCLCGPQPFRLATRGSFDAKEGQSK